MPAGFGLPTAAVSLPSSARKALAWTFSWLAGLPWLLQLAVVFAVACSPVAPSIACMSDSDCLSGVCLAGQCVPKADAAFGDTATDLSSGVDAFSKCKIDDECGQYAGACTLGRCSSGVCVMARLPDDTTCTMVGVGKCTTAGVCEDGVCVPTAVCDDKNPCTVDSCTDAGCNHAVTAQAACNDGDACTRDDACSLAGACIGLPFECTGTSVCGTASCDHASGCVVLPVEGTCDDADPCTTKDACQAGTCTGGPPPDCDDGLPCTADNCLAGIGCGHQPLSAPDAPPCVADGDPCTLDFCSGGSCIGVNYAVCTIGGVCVPAQKVSDGNPCLFCDPAVPNQWSQKNDAPCDDGDACTFATNCVQGQCVGIGMVCDDKSACTKDLCDPAVGCVFLPLDVTCNDDSLCTLGDACKNGKCVGTPLPPATCDDGNACTTDKCDATFGCSHKPNGLPCNDSDPCTKGDQCDAGKCLPGQMACPCLTDAECNDGNPCTVNTCVASGCQAQPLTGPACNDSDACTSGDHCEAGWCKGAAVVCNDKNPCTLDGCVAEVGCVTQALDSTPCNDGNACTSGDLCVQGKCGGSPKFCDDGNPCSLDTCNPTNGVCEHSLFGNGTACPDDGIACTVDQCVGGVCSHADIKVDMCMIQGTCLSGGAISPLDSCLGCLPKQSQTQWSMRLNLPCNDGNPCSVAESCNSLGKCVGPKLACSDNEPCTSDNCNSADPVSPCYWVPIAGACDDGNACTTGDACNAGKCAGSGINCSDANPCTADACVAPGGCSHTPAAPGTACGDDGLACTQDVCQDGACSHPVGAGWCKIAGVCRASGELSTSGPCQVCQPSASATAWTPASSGACDDGNLCTAGDTCNGGVCKAGSAANCDDANPCSTDTCSATAGCQHAVQSGTSCNDGNACTSGDTCLAGTCVGQPVNCAGSPGDSAACLLAACDPALGCVKATSCPSLHECSAGECLTGQGGKFGPVPLNLTAAGMSALVAPTLRWQDTGEDWLGQAPRLWLAGQSSTCSNPAGSGTVAVVKLGPGGAPPQVQLATPAVAGVCGQQPQLVPHPASFARTLLAWLDVDAKTCATGVVRSQVLGSPAVQPGAPTACMPIAGGRAALAVAKSDVNSTVGAQVTALRSGGSLAWHATGAYPDGVVGAGATVTVASAPAAPAKFNFGRPAVTTIGSAQGLLLPVHVAPQNGTDFQPYSQLQFGQVSAAGAQPNWVAVCKGIDVIGTDVAFLAAEAVWDSDAARVLVAVSGTANQGGKVRGFLAHTRFAPSLTSPQTAVVAQWFDPVAGEPPAITAFRLAELPGSTDFLTVWAMPGSAQVWVARLKAANDSKFITQVSQVLLSDFAPISVGLPLTGAGGLSDLVIAPGAARFSLAYEGALGTTVYTGLLPK